MKKMAYTRVCLTGLFLSLTSFTVAHPSAHSIYTDLDAERLKEVQRLLNSDIHCTPYLSASQIIAHLRSEEQIRNHIDYLARQNLFGTNAQLTYNEFKVITQLAAIGYKEPLYSKLKDISDEAASCSPPPPEEAKFAHDHIESVLAAQDPTTQRLNSLCFKMKHEGLTSGFYDYAAPGETPKKLPRGSFVTPLAARKFVLNPFFLTDGLTPAGNQEATRLWLEYGDIEQTQEIISWADDPKSALSATSRHILLAQALERQGWAPSMQPKPENAPMAFLTRLNSIPHEEIRLFAAQKQYALFHPNATSHKKEFLHLVKMDAQRDNFPNLMAWVADQLLVLKGTRLPQKKKDQAVKRGTDLLVTFAHLQDNFPIENHVTNRKENKQELFKFLKPYCLDPVVCSIAIDRYLDLLSPSELQTESRNPDSFLSQLLNSADEQISLEAYTKLFITLKSKVIVDNGKCLASFKKFGKKQQLNEPETDEEQIAEKYTADFTQMGIELLGKMAQSKHLEVALWAIDHRIFGRMSDKQGFPVGLDTHDPKLMDTFIDLLTKWHHEDLARKKS